VAGNWRAERPTTFSAIGQAVGRRRFPPRGRVPAVVAFRDLGPAIWPVAESTDRVDRAAAAILDQGDRVTTRDRRAPVAMAAAFLDVRAEAIDPVAVIDREDRAVVMAACARIVPAAVIVRVDRVMEMAADLADPATVIGPADLVTDQAIAPAVPAIDPIGRIVRTIVPIADQIGTNDRIGETIVGPT
jgi:hypothetical protein